MKSTPPGTVRSIEPRDFLGTSIFLEKMSEGIISRKTWLDCFEHWWSLNPNIERTERTGWVLCGEDEMIKGFHAYIKVKYVYDGKDVDTYCATSWYIDHAYRNQSLELLKPFLNIPKPCLLINTTPTKSVESIYRHFKFKKLELNWHQETLLVPLDISNLLNIFFKKKISVPCLGKILNYSKIFTFLLSQIILLIFSIRLRGKSSFSFSEITEFTSDYSLLWGKFSSKQSFALKRDLVSLNWLFFGSPTLRSFRKILEVRKQKKLLAYVAINLITGNANSEQYHYFEVVDMITDCDTESEETDFKAILKGILNLAKNCEKKIIYIKISPFDVRIRKYWFSFGFAIKGVSPAFLTKYISDQDTNIETKMAQDFYSTPLDGDRGFFV